VDLRLAIEADAELHACAAGEFDMPFAHDGAVGLHAQCKARCRIVRQHAVKFLEPGKRREHGLTTEEHDAEMLALRGPHEGFEGLPGNSDIHDARLAAVERLDAAVRATEIA